MKTLIVIGGSASPKLSARVSRLLRCRLVRPELKRFPDGELYVRIKADLRRRHVVVVQSTPAPQNDNLMELLLLLHTSSELGARKITAVVPYLAYARQDKRFKPGEAVSLRTVARLVESAGADELITVDIHEEHSLDDFTIPARNLTAMPLLGQYLKRLRLKRPVVIGGDQGSEPRAKMVAQPLGAPYDYLVKHRITPTRVVTKPKKLDVRGHEAIIADDIISTGGTVIEAARILKRQGAARIYAVCTHGVFAHNALKRLQRAGITVVSTDTIEGPTSRVSVAPLVAQALA